MKLHRHSSKWQRGDEVERCGNGIGRMGSYISWPFYVISYRVKLFCMLLGNGSGNTLPFFFFFGITQLELDSGRLLCYVTVHRTSVKLDIAKGEIS